MGVRQRNHMIYIQITCKSYESICVRIKPETLLNNTIVGIFKHHFLKTLTHKHLMPKVTTIAIFIGPLIHIIMPAIY